MEIEKIRDAGFEVVEAAEPYYERLAVRTAIQIAREMINEWDYEDDAHGYCHQRSIIVALVLAAEKTA